MSPCLKCDPLSIPGDNLSISQYYHYLTDSVVSWSYSRDGLLPLPRTPNKLRVKQCPGATHIQKNCSFIRYKITWSRGQFDLLSLCPEDVPPVLSLLPDVLAIHFPTYYPCCMGGRRPPLLHLLRTLGNSFGNHSQSYIASLPSWLRNVGELSSQNRFSCFDMV